MTTQNEYDDGQGRARRSERTFVKFVAVLLFVVVGVPIALVLFALLALAPAHRSVSIGQIAVESSHDRSLQGEMSLGHSVDLGALLPRQAPAPDPPRKVYSNSETTLQAVDGIQDHSETVDLATELSTDQDPESAVEVVESPPDSTTAEAVPAEAPATATKPENIDLEKPLIGVTYPEGRPKWLDKAIGRGPRPFIELGHNYSARALREGQASLRDQVILTEPFSDSGKCDENLDACLKVATWGYIHTSVPKAMAVDKIASRMGNVRNRIVQEDYRGPITTSVGDVYEAAARIRFDDAFDKDVQIHWKQIRANERIKQVGFMLGSVVVLLSTVFGFFQLDTSSKGYYTGRLRFGLVLSWLAAAALGAFIFRSIWWI